MARPITPESNCAIMQSLKHNELENRKMRKSIRKVLALSLLRASEKLMAVINQIRRRREALDFDLNENEINEIKTFEVKLAELRRDMGLQPREGDEDLVDLDIEFYESSIPSCGLEYEELVKATETVMDDLNLEDMPIILGNENNAIDVLTNICLKQQERIEELSIEMEETQQTLFEHGIV